MRIIPIALAIALSPSLGLAQSGPATAGTTQPTTTAPRIGEPKGISAPKSKIPPAAQSGANRGLRYGQGAADGSPIEIKRNK